MKPFNKAEALKGAPVVLRNGAKAFVKFEIAADQLINSSNIRDALYGYIVGPLNIAERTFSWKEDGRVWAKSENALDIVGMWEEPRQNITIRIPQPLKAGEIMKRVGGEIFVVCQPSGLYIGAYIKEIEVTTEGINWHSWDLVHKGFAFATKADAESFLAAMKTTVAE
ncbi:hypothetical protein [uncultured Aggregatibacter sp.]|uniref:hypothetical protein n=1 Tax=uncultured Aggregatibacter sp. TaxID=470564 RepID=UPI0026259A39|nr:hypothetical protein [uncultured Aggregatibacter sp.]